MIRQKNLPNNHKKKLIRNIVLSLPVIFIMLPFLIIFTGSFMKNDEARITYGGILNSTALASFVIMPARPSLQPWADLLLYCRQFYTMFRNSVIYTVSIVTGQVLTSIPASWAFAKLQTPLKKVIFTIYIVLMMLPFQVTMLSNYFILDNAKLLNTPWAFILPCMFSTFPVFIMTRFFSDVPDELIAAAKTDGASSFQAFWYIGLPVGKSGIAAVVTLQILEIWNALEQPLFFIQNEEYFPLAIFFPNLTPDTFGSAFAAAIVMMVPPVFVFLYGREDLQNGIMHIGILK